MKVTGSNNSYFSLKVKGYQLKDSVGEGCSSDWLKGEVLINKDGFRIERTLELLILEELEQLKEWLIMIDDYENCPKRFSFLDSDVGCILHKRGGEKVVKWIIRINESEREYVDMLCEKGVLDIILGELNEILNNFPCRCGSHHSTLAESRDNIPFGLCCDEYPDVFALGLVPRVFKGGYKDQQDLIAGNLYSWLHQTKRILWDLDLEKKRITFYTEPIIRLGRRMATLERIDQDQGERIMMDLVYQLSLKEMKWSIENHWTSREDNPKLYNEVLNETEDQNMRNVLIRFMKMFVEQ